MHSITRDVRLLILAVSAGSADGWSYFGLGHAFVANMTGNTVLLGIAVFQNHRDLIHPAISLGCYAIGAVIGSVLGGTVPPGASWSRAISWTLMLEALLLVAAEIGWMAVHPHLNLLLGIVALGIGMQSGAMVQLKIPGIVTTYITGTWTTLLSGLVRFSRKPPRKPAKEDFEQRLLMQACILSAYFLSAVLTGWLLRHLPRAVGALPALCLLAVALHGLLGSE